MAYRIHIRLLEHGVDAQPTAAHVGHPLRSTSPGVCVTFPTEYHTNWQWWELINGSSAMMLDDLPPDLRPILQVIDTWFEARRLGLIFEVAVGEGKLLVCSMDIVHDLETRPAARQMRHSLLQYMASRDFAPKTIVKLDQIQRLFRRNG